MKRRSDEWGPFIAFAPAAFLLVVEGTSLVISEIRGGVEISAGVTPFGLTVVLGLLAPAVLFIFDQEDAGIWSVVSIGVTVVSLVIGSFLAVDALHCTNCFD